MNIQVENISKYYVYLILGMVTSFLWSKPHEMYNQFKQYIL